MKLVGNENTHKQLKIAIRSAIAENRPIPHTLLSGAAGCGKTSTAKYLSEITGCSFINAPCDKLKNKDELLSLIENLDDIGYTRHGKKTGAIKPTIVFIDEIHGLNAIGQEHLGILMEEWYIPIGFGQSKLDPRKHPEIKGNVIRWSPQFTLIGATTNDGLLSKPFRDRFKLRFLFSTYDIEESIKIVLTHVTRLNKKDQTKVIGVTQEAVFEIAKRGRGVPRIIVSLLERCRDFAIHLDTDIVTKKETDAVFELNGIDATGLNSVDIKILTLLYEVKIPVGLDNLAITLNESKKVLVETTEPYLIQRGLITRASKGRILTEKGRDYLIAHGHIKTDNTERFDIPTTYDRQI